ncbi:MAG: methyltransferase domain-containing protein [Anaerolineae bacterium]
MSRYERMKERYLNGRVPWDDVLPPPEVIELIPTLPPGRALDLGCGYGRASIFMARHGWQVDGVDFVAEAVAEAARRAEAAGVSDKIHFHESPVSELDYLTGTYDFALDVGCMHSLDEVELQRYAAALRRLLRPGAVYLLYARLQEPDQDAESGPRGVPEQAVKALFADGFDLEQFVPGETAVEDRCCKMVKCAGSREASH